MIEEFADDQVTTFKVTSFTPEHTKYDIVVEIMAMMSRTLPHSLPPMEMMLLDQQSQADPPVQLQEAPRSHQNQAMGNVEKILTMLNNYKRNPWALTDEQIEQLSTIKTTLAYVLRSPNPNSNTNFLPQRK
ncbi:hypothetical protein G6F42_014284 [Rhizopus arrhizus]|nr:hypothetical protein G6F42_014284 [Rhizopus arrhizus]